MVGAAGCRQSRISQTCLQRNLSSHLLCMKVVHVVTSAHKIIPALQDSGGTRRSTRFQAHANDPDAKLAAKLQAELDQVMSCRSTSPGSRAAESNHPAGFLEIVR